MDRFSLSEHLHHPGDVLRRRAAAAAEHSGARVGQGFHIGGKCIRPHIVMGLAVLSDRRKARVRLRNDRDAHHPFDSLNETHELIRSVAAVDADGGGAHRLQCLDDVKDTAAVVSLPISLDGHRADDRDVRHRHRRVERDRDLIR